ncbi:hypothetical protein SASPL_146567 [Salvia splendens]|uniref:Uncharacterized protein n=1 Tax=Salvia splendens TaxID=180675 RepID=A0A8X8WCV1_SALSN|nr:hypothetical protein SASPL_146567 [Salvia splendens]
MANSIDIVVENRKGDEAEAAASASSVLTRVNAGYFTISLSLGAQAVLLNTLIDDHATTKLKFYFNLVVADRILGPWAMLMTWLSLCTLALISSLYILRCVFHLWLVKAEYSDRVAVNFLFVPWISWLLLLRATPQRVLLRLPHEVLLWALVAPIVALDVKLYGQWFTSEKRSLSAVANPTSHLPMVGNFVGAWAAAGVGWRETALCLFAVGLVHYVVVFITLYQRLTGFRAALRPISFLFFGTPSAACLAWSAISGGFGVACKMLFFLSLFLLASLVNVSAGVFQEIDKEVQRGMVGVLVSRKLRGGRINAVRGGSEGCGGGWAYATTFFTLIVGFCGNAHTHSSKY